MAAKKEEKLTEKGATDFLRKQREELFNKHNVDLQQWLESRKLLIMPYFNIFGEKMQIGWSLQFKEH